MPTARRCWTPVAPSALVALGFVALLGARGTAETTPTASYDRDIRPILSDKCYHCHGPDAESRQAELRLDTPSAAIDLIASPGMPEKSELLRRIGSADPSERMPPPDSGLSLSSRERELLAQWVTQGAPFSAHWAFTPLPAQVEAPSVKNQSWAQSPIDRFVLAQLESLNLPPSPRASSLALLRRVTFDLTGAPPTSDETVAYEIASRTAPQAAYAEAVERLLESRGFGEHFAVAWLDAARYADSHGYQSDQLNTQWPYRDWVVRALNDNLPYDQFITWQLAGDLLPNPTSDQILATAFCRMHRMTNEGGSIAAEWLNENACDRVHTFGTAILGLTLECARCHDHKYDPILQRDYYALQAFFNSIDENGLYDSTSKVPSPTLMLPTPAQAEAIAAAQREIAAAEQAIEADRAAGEERFRQWLKQLPSTAPLPDLAAHFSFDDASPSADPGSKEAPPPRIVASETRDPSVDSTATPIASVPGTIGKGIQFDGDRRWQIAAHDAFRTGRTDAFTVDFWLKDEAGLAESVVVADQTEGSDVGPNGFDVMLADGIVEARLYRVWPGNAIGVRAVDRLAQGAWKHVAVVYDGSSRASGLRLFVDGEAAPTEIIRDNLHKESVDGAPWFTLGGRFRDRGFRDGSIDELRLFQRALTPLELRQLHDPEAFSHVAASTSQSISRPSAERASNSLSELRALYFSSIDASQRGLTEALGKARRRLVDVENAVHEVAVMRELPAPRPAYVLARGAYDAPKSSANRIERDVFSQLLIPLPKDAPRDRLGLAKWTTSPNHPLTARVFVNRLWANFFGQSLAVNPENLGSQGARPTHVDLLDWLARDFVDHGWDIKHLCRRIALSAVYQQDSRLRSELNAVDPENRLLARGPIRRLASEQMRDAALVASGLLTGEAGGPPVSPYQPGGDLWRESNSMSPPYVQSKGANLYRRSLYSVWKRTAPLPNMLAFDAPSREVCTVRRTATSTPLQALVLLNDIQFVEAARALAQRVLSDSSDSRGQIAAAFLHVAGRRADDDEMRVLVALFDEQVAHFQQTQGAADDLLQVGSLPTPASADRIHLAALTVACQSLLNMDAAAYVR